MHSALFRFRKVGNLIRGSRNGLAKDGIPSPSLSRLGRSPKNPLQVFIEILINAIVNGQADAPYLEERS